MEFLPPGPSFRAAFYPGHQPAGNKAAGGFLGPPLPSCDGERCKPQGLLDRRRGSPPDGVPGSQVGCRIQSLRKGVAVGPVRSSTTPLAKPPSVLPNRLHYFSGIFSGSPPPYWNVSLVPSSAVIS